MVGTPDVDSSAGQGFGLGAGPISKAVGFLLENQVGPILGFTKTKSASAAERRQARRQAALIREDALRQTSALGRDTGRLLGSQRAAFGAAGVQQFGTPEQLAAEAQFEATLEINRVLTGANRTRNALIEQVAQQTRAANRAAEYKLTEGSIKTGVAFIEAGIGQFL